MKKEFVSINNLKIAFYIKNPEHDQTIFFIHGNSSSSRQWNKQLESPLLHGYRLISIDLPSHGGSDALPKDSDFSLPGIGELIGKAITKLINTKPYIICSISLGTNVVAEMLVNDYSPAGLLFAGPCIVGEGFELDKMILKDADLTAIVAEKVPSAVINKYLDDVLFSDEESSRMNFLEDYYSVKGSFRSSLYATIAAGLYNDEIMLLKKKNYPVCIVFGKDEKIVNIHYLDNASLNLWSDKIYTLPGASHFVNIDASIDFNALVAKFAADLFTKGAV